MSKPDKNRSQFNFEQIESLRKSMLLTTANMSQLLGVTRQMYFKWRKNPTNIRDKNLRVILHTLKKLFKLLNAGWPQPFVVASDQRKRMELLLDALDKLEPDS